MSEYIERDAAVKAAQDGADEWDGGFNRTRDTYIEAAIDNVPTVDLSAATSTVYGYPIEHLVMIARVMAKENCTPEVVVQMLQNAGEIAKMVRDEMLEMFNESIERTCKGVANEEGMDHRVGFRKGRIPDRIQSKR